MTWRISEAVNDILTKGGDFAGINRDQAMRLMKLPLHSKEVYALMETAHRMSRQQFGRKAENHFHIGLNVEACPLDCTFCSLARSAGIFREKQTFQIQEVIAWAKMGEAHGADALNLMTTGTYPFKRLLEIGRQLKQVTNVPLVANTRDITHREGEQLVRAGFSGFYHAVRLGEGRDTPLKREKRVATIQVIKDVGLLWMNCIEPVGPEHDLAEIVDLMFLAREHGAVYSGVMRRINFPGSPMEKFGMISELQMARMVAVSRLVMGSVPEAHCTHEPNTVALMSGANLFFPEVGSSPRDAIADTGVGRGRTLTACRQIQKEMDWDPALPSNCFLAAAGGNQQSIRS
jgi:biotin synthase